MLGNKFVDLYSMTVASGPVSYRSQPLGTMPFVRQSLYFCDWFYIF